VADIHGSITDTNFVVSGERYIRGSHPDRCYCTRLFSSV